MDKEVVISIKTILFTLLFFLGGYIVYRLGPVIGILIVSTLIVFSVEPLIKYFRRGTLFNKPISRSVAVMMAYLILFVIFASIVTIVLPPVITQTQKLLKSLSEIAAQLQLSNKTQITIPDLLPQASNLSGNVVTTTLAIFSNIATLFSILIISLYMSLDWENLKKRFSEMFHSKYREEILEGLEEVEVNIGHWIKGQLILMLIIGAFSYIGLTALDVEYAISLSLISGVLEIVPMIGPIISAILAGTVAFVDSSSKGIGVMVLYAVIQQLENNIIVPQVMKKVSGFSPLAILLALLIGSEFFGVAGAIMALPVTMILAIVMRRFLGRKA